jgi:tellurite resistance protein TehA-like permease
MNRKIVLFVVPIIVGLLFVTPFIYNWQRNKELVGYDIKLKKIVDDMFIPIIYLAFVFSYCVTLSCIILIYLIERKEKHKVKS